MANPLVRDAVGDVIVPVIGARDGWSTIRQDLVAAGVYPGVEYRCTSILCSGEQLSSTAEAPPGAFESGQLQLVLRPVYPLVQRLERQWPVSIAASSIPIVLTPFAYNAATAYAALSTSAALAMGGAALAATLSLSVIPSRSMEPTLLPGDVVLVVSACTILYSRLPCAVDSTHRLLLLLLGLFCKRRAREAGCEGSRKLCRTTTIAHPAAAAHISASIHTSPALHTRHVRYTARCRRK